MFFLRLLKKKYTFKLVCISNSIEFYPDNAFDGDVLLARFVFASVIHPDADSPVFCPFPVAVDNQDSITLYTKNALSGKILKSHITGKRNTLAG